MSRQVNEITGGPPASGPQLEDDVTHSPYDEYTSISVCMTYTVYRVHFLLEIKCTAFLLPVDRDKKFLRNAGEYPSRNQQPLLYFNFCLLFCMGVKSGLSHCAKIPLWSSGQSSWLQIQGSIPGATILSEK
jgi:hypothetical protein